jgi:biotin-(acetyl-CoA carboxylase) ligase
MIINSPGLCIPRNYSFASALPAGLVCLATNQIAGRGKERTAWGGGEENMILIKCILIQRSWTKLLGLSVGCGTI